MFPPPEPSSRAVSSGPTTCSRIKPEREGGLVRVFGGWRQEMEPGRQLVAVEIRCVPVAHGCTVPASRLAC